MWGQYNVSVYTVVVYSQQLYLYIYNAFRNLTKTGLFSKWFNNSTNEKRPPLIYEFVFLLISSILKVRSVTLLEEECPSPSPFLLLGSLTVVEQMRDPGPIQPTQSGVKRGQTDACCSQGEQMHHSRALNKIPIHFGLFWIS